MTTLLDLIAASARQLSRAGVSVGHLYDNALDEARSLVLHGLFLAQDWPAHLAHARLLPEEIERVQSLLKRRIDERIPAAYLIGHADFAGLRMKTDSRALVPRSPIAELILGGFQSLPRPKQIKRALDLCTGGGSIALAMAAHQPQWLVDGSDLSLEALQLAAENRRLLGLEQRVRLIQSDLYQALQGQRYELIVSNPPYLSQAEFAQLPAEYAHEPAMALPSGADGLDLTIQILHGAIDHLQPEGLLVVEIGEAEVALRRLLPQLELIWIPFSVGPMGVFAITETALRRGADAIAAEAQRRSGHTKG